MRAHGLLALLTTGCAHARPPMVTGAEVYAQVRAIQAEGHASIRGAIEVRRDQVLATDAQEFVVGQVVEHCRGGDPASEVDCAIALLLDQKFAVLDRAPDRGGAGARHGDDRSGSLIASVAVIALGAAAIGGLVYGVATCEFAGCKAVFGVPIALVGGGALFLLGRD